MPPSLTLQLVAKTSGFQSQLSAAQKSFARQTRKMLGDSRAFRKIGTELKNLGSSLTFKLTAPMVAAGTFFTKTAGDFESDFAGVRKTVNATAEEFKQLEAGIRAMAKEIPASTREISGVAEAAGQLNISKKDILSFTRTMIDLGNTTDLSAREAATALARFANITKLPQKEISRLGSTVVDLGNNMATTEREIIDMSLRMAASAGIVGLLESDTLALAGAMTSVGIQAEAGGTAMSKIMIELASAIKEPGKQLGNFAEISGLTVAEFQKSFEKDAAKTLTLFIEGLDRMAKSGGNVFGVLEDMGLAEIRVRNALLATAGAGDLLREAIDRGRKAWQENTALTKEAEERYKTFNSQMLVLKNRFSDLFISLGQELIPTVKRFIDESISPMIEKVKEGIKWFKGLDDATKDMFIQMAVALAVGGPLLVGLGIFVASLNTLGPFIALAVTMLSGTGGLIAILGGLAIAMADVKWQDFSDGARGAAIEIGKLTEELKKANVAALEVVRNSALNKFLNKLFKDIEDGVRNSDINKWLNELTGSLDDWENAIANSSVNKFLNRVTGSLVETGKAAREEAKSTSTSIVASTEEWTGKTTKLEAELAVFREKWFQERKGREIAFTAVMAGQQEMIGKIAQSVATKRLRIAKAFGKSQESLGRWIVAQEQKRFNKGKKAFFTVQDAKEQAARGVANTIKLLWSDSSITFKQVWKNALNVFVDTLTQMAVQAKFVAKDISISMAAASAGISLLIGLIASTFGGKTGKSRIQKATEDFLREIKNALKGFEDEVLTTLEKLNRARKGKDVAVGILEGISEFTEKSGVLDFFVKEGFNRDKIINNSKIILESIQAEFRLKKESITEIINLLKREKDFIKEIDQSITGVRRAFFSDAELFEAQKKDIQDLQGLIAVATGETKLSLSNELSQALLASFETAKSVLEGDPGQLAAWQQTVIDGLEGVKDSGSDAFQQLIDIQFEELNVLKGSKVTQKQMEDHLRKLGLAARDSAALLGAIAKGDTSSATINDLVSQMNTLFPSNPIALAHGGIVTKPTMALIAEAGEAEAVIPLSKMASVMGGTGARGGGGGNSFYFSFPNIRNLNDMTDQEAERLLQGKFSRAAERLDDSGVVWPMAAQSRRDR